MEIYERIELLRRRSLLSGYELADKLGISYSTYRRIVTGETNPTLDKLKKLAAIFEVPVEFFTDNKVAFDANMSHQMRLNESRIEYATVKGKKGEKRVKPVRLILEIDPDYEPDSLPKFLQELEEMLERYSGGHSEN